MTEKQTHRQHVQSPQLPQGDDKPLQSWKEISVYLERDVRTARRWEQAEGLPVRRHRSGGRSSVYAYPRELEAWRVARKPKAGEELQRPPWRRLIPALAGGLALLAVAAVVLWGPIMNPPGPLAEAANVGDGISTKQVWSAPGRYPLRGSVSPDGRYFFDGFHGPGRDLVVRDLARD